MKNQLEAVTERIKEINSERDDHYSDIRELNEKLMASRERANELENELKFLTHLEEQLIIYKNTYETE